MGDPLRQQITPRNTVKDWLVKQPLCSEAQKLARHAQASKASNQPSELHSSCNWRVKNHQTSEKCIQVGKREKSQNKQEKELLRKYRQNFQETIINIHRHKMLKKIRIQAKDFYPTKPTSHIKDTNCYQQLRT